MSSNSEQNNSSTESILPWVSLDEIPFHDTSGSLVSAPILLNKDQLIVAMVQIPSHRRESNSHTDKSVKATPARGIWAFDLMEKVWTHKCSFDEDILVNSETPFVIPSLVSIPNNDKEFYFNTFAGVSHYVFCKIHIWDSKHTIIDPGYNWYERLSKEQQNKTRNQKLKDKMVYKMKMEVKPASMLVLKSDSGGDCIHLIGCLENDHKTQHMIYDCNTGKLKMVHTIQKTFYFEGYSFIHLKKRNQLLLIGGWLADNIFDNVWFYDLDASEWHQETELAKRYQIDLCCYQCLIACNEKDLIILGGYSSRHERNYKIYILDLDTLLLSESMITRPDEGFSACVDESLSTNGLNNGNNMNLFIHAYLRRLGVYNLFIPYDMILIIKRMYQQEMIHLMSFNGGMYSVAPKSRHYMVSVDEILKQKRSVPVEEFADEE